MFSALASVRMSAVTVLAQALMSARSALALVYTVTPGAAPHGVIAIMHGIVGITELRNEYCISTPSFGVETGVRSQS
jgi:hypothetical protein